MATTMNIRLTEEMHKKIKIQATLKGITITEYILGLVDKDLKEENSKTDDK